MDNNTILKGIADNPALSKAVREVLEKHFSLDEALLGNESLTNEYLGQVVRARLEGLKLIDASFKEIDRYKTVTNQPRTINRAR